MERYKIVKYSDLTNIQKNELIEVFIAGFGHLMTFSKDKEQLKRIFRNGMNEEYTFAYIEKDSVLGMVGIATNKLRPIKFDKEICIEVLGKRKGSVVCKQMNSIFQSQVVKKDTDLYIDFLTTSEQARNRGVATKLLEYCFSLEGYQDYYIEVFSKNFNAKRLYEKLNFVPYKKQVLSPMRLLGYGYPIKMLRTIIDK